MQRRTVFWCVAVVAAVTAAGWAWSLRWTCDDAYISFRYADHLVGGHGLVFNLDPNEAPVEGYTNFAWTMLLALGIAVGNGGDALEGWASALGSLCHAATVLVLAWAAWRAGGGRMLLPAAGIAYALHYHAATLAPAGLETAMFTLLATAMAVAAISAVSARGWLVTGVLGVLAMTTRPDGAICCAMAGLVLLHDVVRARAWRPLLGFASPFVLLYLPYFLWKWSYYGYPLPNTFYAKSGDKPYITQGLHYTAEYLKCYWVLLPALLLLPLLALWPRRRSPSAAGAWNGRRPAVVAGMFVLSYLLFVVWVGGDFMFARFLLPVAPLSLLAFDLLAARLPALSATLLAVAAGAATFWRHEPDYLANYQNPHGFSDNRAISLALAPGYTVPWTEACRASGHYLGQLCAGLPVHVGIAGSHANLAWRGLFPVAIECASGLTDAFIAHLPVAGRSTVGHERNYTLYPGYLQRRGVQIMFELSWHTGGPVDPLRTVVFPSQPVPTEARLVTYDRALMRELKRRDPGVMYYDFEQILDRYLVELPHKDKAEVSNDFAAFKDYYFDHNDDPQRRAVFEQFLQGR